MLKVFAFLQNFVTGPVRRDDRGITSVEYGLLLFIVAAGLITALAIFTPVLSGLFTNFTP
jgi:Flp pilus assembly pilin Flp